MKIIKPHKSMLEQSTHSSRSGLTWTRSRLLLLNILGKLGPNTNTRLL